MRNIYVISSSYSDLLPIKKHDRVVSAGLSKAYAKILPRIQQAISKNWRLERFIEKKNAYLPQGYQVCSFLQCQGVTAWLLWRELSEAEALCRQARRYQGYLGSDLGKEER